MKMMITGGAGFIGSCFVRTMLEEARESALRILTIDKLTYAGNLENLEAVAGDQRHQFLQIDITDTEAIDTAFSNYHPDVVVHFAAESHVDRSILAPTPVFETNLRGTFTLLEAARRHGIGTFVHVSTDEVYGSIPAPLDATEESPLSASSPYSASKAGSDLLALSYFTTYNLPVIVTRASNNYGPFQFPEKLIPLMIINALAGKTLPVYGDGMQVRDWLYVKDHCQAIATIIHKGRHGQIYNIGGNRSLPNIEVVKKILSATGQSESLIRHVTDRPGHDRRYALSSAKLRQETGWTASTDFEAGIAATVDWYRSNPTWIAHVQSGEYQKFYATNYGYRI